MRIDKLSEKQAEIFSFVVSDVPYLICDGAVRSGKTVCMAVAFVLWAMEYFDQCRFAICGKTVANAERNVLTPLMLIENLPYRMKYNRAERKMVCRCGTRENSFYLFGGKDESSYTLIQGITLAGVLLDEVALMPRSFVDQAMARTLTYPNAKIWFNCNPESQIHWFNQEWIIPADKGTRRAKHLHFLMEDNPIIGADEIQKAEDMFTGVFYQRYILGLWVAAEGLVYADFNKNDHVVQNVPNNGLYYISIDYGTLNPCSMGLWCINNGVAYRVAEYYYNGREKRKQKTDEEYYAALEQLAGERMIQEIIVDPSAASFIETIRRHGTYRVTKAKNAVLDGIRVASTLLKAKRIKIHENCTDIINEFQSYSWDDRKSEDAVIKENDHAMDDMRYFCMTILHGYFRW